MRTVCTATRAWLELQRPRRQSNSPPLASLTAAASTALSFFRFANQNAKRCAMIRTHATKGPDQMVATNHFGAGAARSSGQDGQADRRAGRTQGKQGSASGSTRGIGNDTSKVISPRCVAGALLSPHARGVTRFLFYDYFYTPRIHISLECRSL